MRDISVIIIYIAGVEVKVRTNIFIKNKFSEFITTQPSQILVYSSITLFSKESKTYTNHFNFVDSSVSVDSIRNA